MPKQGGYDFNDLLKTGGIDAVSDALSRTVKIPELSALSPERRMEVVQKISQSFRQNGIQGGAEAIPKQAKIETVLSEQQGVKEGILKQESERISHLINGKKNENQSPMPDQKVKDTLEKEL
jgi:hypothetical protein